MDNTEISKHVTFDSEMAIRDQINQKTNYDRAFYARCDDVGRSVTDMDNFPYNRFFRGDYRSQNPTVINREAGYRPRNNSCYRGVIAHNKYEYPNHCFESACSVVYPCYPGYLHKYSDKEELEVMLNRKCVDRSP